MSSESVYPSKAVREFHTTRWSVVFASQDDSDATRRKAIEELCEIYWYPIYAFIRRRGNNAHEAQELTQAFFVKVIQSGFFAKAEPAKGNLRSFLMKSVSNFLISNFKRSEAANGKKLEFIDFDQGEHRYSAEIATEETAERLFERRWALTLIDGVMDRLNSDTAERFGTDQADTLLAQLRGHGPDEPLQQIAERLGISEPALKVRMHRLRKRYRELLRAEVAETIAPGESIDEELQQLISLL